MTKYILDVPDQVHQLSFNKDGTPRKTPRTLIQDETGCSEPESKFYSRVLRDGHAINYTSAKPPASGETKKYLIVGDTHFPYHDKRNVEIMIDYGLQKGCTELVIAGDGVDFYKVSQFYKKPTYIPFAEEVEVSRGLLSTIAGAFSGQKVYIKGNHEKRLDAYIIKNAPDLYGVKIKGELIHDISAILDLKYMEFEYVDNEALLQAGLSPFKIGDLSVWHGHEIRVGAEAIGLAKLYFEKTGHVNVMCFHNHRRNEWVRRNVYNRYYGAWSVGTLGHMNPDYLPVNNWTAGGAIVTVDADGYFEVENKKIIDGRVL